MAGQLTPCPDCGHMISTRATKCPNCGAPRPAQPLPSSPSQSALLSDAIWQKRAKVVSGMVGAVVFGVVLLYFFGTKNAEPPSRKPSPSQPNRKPSTSQWSPESTPQSSQYRVTQAHYQQIQNGMSYSQVVHIIGFGGEEMANVTTDGVPGVRPSINAIMYSWSNGDGSSMNAQFQNDRLIAKGQFGLE